VKLSPARSSAEARVWSVTPLLVVVTITFALWVEGAWLLLPLLPWLLVPPVPPAPELGGAAIGDPPGVSPEPPEEARPVAGRASVPHSTAHAA
jgi:hypothetical protein